MNTVTLTLQDIRIEYPKYKGEWPISNWCYQKLRTKAYKDATVLVYDRHPDEADFIVPSLKSQAKFFKDRILKKYASVEGD